VLKFVKTGVMIWFGIDPYVFKLLQNRPAFSDGGIEIVVN